MIRLFLALAAAAATMGGVSQAQVARQDPDLAIAVINTMADVCFPTARGVPPTRETAAALMLDPLSAPPSALGGRFDAYPTWFDVKRSPSHVFVAVGDKPRACHIIVANTTQTSEVQAKVVVVLSTTGFQRMGMAQAANPAVNDQMFVKLVPDGYIVVNVYGPRKTVGDGSGDQAVIHVSLVPKAVFEAIVKRR